MWSAQAVCKLKIRTLNTIYLHCAEPKAANSAVGIGTHTDLIFNPLLLIELIVWSIAVHFGFQVAPQIKI